MRYISFNYSRLDRFRQAISGSYMVNVGLYISNNIKRNTPREGAGERLNRGVFLVTVAAPGCHTLRGGVVPRFHPTVWPFHIYISLSFLYSYPLLNRLHWADPGKFGRTIATPPKRRGSCGPHRGAEFHASIRPPWVAIVLNYPCGKARIGGADAPETGTSLVPRIQ